MPKLTEQQEKCMECHECCEYIEIPTSMIGGLEVLEYWMVHGKKFYISDLDGALHIRFYAPCQHLKDGKCSIYENRPWTCRQYMCSQKDKSIKEIKEQACKETMAKVKELIAKHRKEQNEN